MYYRETLDFPAAADKLAVDRFTAEVKLGGNGAGERPKSRHGVDVDRRVINGDTDRRSRVRRPSSAVCPRPLHRH